LAVTAGKLRESTDLGDVCYIGVEVPTNLSGTEEACNLALAVGAIGAVVGIIGLVSEFVVEKGGAIMVVVKRFVFLGLMVVAILTAILWIATFVYLIYLWEAKTVRRHLLDDIKNSAGTVMAFSFLSVAVQVVIAVLEKIDHGNALSVPVP
jgi:hypothetical protein